MYSNRLVGMDDFCDSLVRFGASSASARLRPRAAPRRSCAPDAAAQEACLPCRSAADVALVASNGGGRRTIALVDVRCVACLIRAGRPFMIGRTSMGSEVDAACFAGIHRPAVGSSAVRAQFNKRLRSTLSTNAGVRTADAEDAYAYGRCFAAAVNVSDVMMRWQELPKLRPPLDSCNSAGKTYQKTDALLWSSGHWPCFLVGTRALQPWLEPPTSVREQPNRTHWRHSANDTWTTALAGRTVLVVHPFNTTIRRQLARGSAAIWGDDAPLIWPAGMRLKFVRPPVNLAGESEDTDWRGSLRRLAELVDGAGHFDVALISCGGLGMLLAAHLRMTNRSAVYTGGALQMWFGILGKRWYDESKHKAHLRRFVSHPNWTRPDVADKPRGAARVEAGTYW